MFVWDWLSNLIKSDLNAYCTCVNIHSFPFNEY